MIEIKALVEIAGYPREHVKNTMDEVIQRIKEDKQIIVRSVKISDASKLETVWSVLSEFEIEFENVNTFLSFCFDYLPTSVEIINPQKLALSSNELSGFVNDLLLGVHKYHLVISNMDAELKALKATQNLSPQDTKKEPAQKKKANK